VTLLESSFRYLDGVRSPYDRAAEVDFELGLALIPALTPQHIGALPVGRSVLALDLILYFRTRRAPVGG
jgi:hypothetical protein